MSYIEFILDFLEGCIANLWFMGLLLGTGVYFTLYLGFPQWRYSLQSLRILKQQIRAKPEPGTISPLQTLATALSGSIGTGSIAGVALAIHVGGPSSLCWMLLTALLGMSIRFVEVTLSHAYREKSLDGTWTGGPMYYMKHQLKMPWLGKIFAVATILSALASGNLPQTSNIASSLYFSFGLPEWLSGLVVSMLLGVVILGGIQRIGQVSAKLAPLMTIIYLVGALSVLGCHYDQILPAFWSIFANVLSGHAATGGFLGGSVALACFQGVNRGLYCADTGSGAVAIAHASSSIKNSIEQGIVSIIEPLITIGTVCMLSGMVILTSGAWKNTTHNKFKQTDIEILAYSKDQSPSSAQLKAHVCQENTLPLYQGVLLVKQGKIQNSDILFLHNHSMATAIAIQQQGQLFTGSVPIQQGKIDLTAHRLTISGQSLVKDAMLTAHAFTFGWLGHWGSWISSISLLLFAFTSAVTWSYYGDRALVYLGGAKYVKLYKIIYVAIFGLGAIIDTTLLWKLSNIVYACMTIPNLVGMLLLRKTMKTKLQAYQRASIK